MLQKTARIFQVVTGTSIASMMLELDAQAAKCAISSRAKVTHASFAGAPTARQMPAAPMPTESGNCQQARQGAVEDHQQTAGQARRTPPCASFPRRSGPIQAIRSLTAATAAGCWSTSGLHTKAAGVLLMHSTQLRWCSASTAPLACPQASDR